jgi:hypothetical protein
MLVKLEFVDGSPFYVNPDHVVSVRMSVGEGGPAVGIHLRDDATGWLLRGELEDIVNILQPQRGVYSASAMQPLGHSTS